MDDYERIESVFDTYDFIAVAARQGDLYVAQKFFTLLINTRYQHPEFNTLNGSQLGVCGLLVMCDIKNINFPTIWDRAGAAADLLDRKKRQKWLQAIQAAAMRRGKKTAALKEDTKE